MQFHKDIKQFQSDQCGEFWSFTSYLAQHGIIHQVICSHTSEQNGIVERKHRHGIEVGLILLAQAHLPMKCWGYAFSCVIHLINRLRTLVLKDQLPYSVLHGNHLDYAYLWGFRCCSYLYL